MADELNSYNLKSYETIRFSSGKNYSRKDEKDRKLLKWLTTDKMWEFIKSKKLELTEENTSIYEEKYNLYMIVLFCVIYKKREMKITKAKYRKIKKMARQRHDEMIDTLVFQGNKVALVESEMPKMRENLCKMISDSERIKDIKTEMTSDLAADLEVQIWEYNKE